MAGAGLQLTRIDCGVIKQGVIPKDEAEHERRLPWKINVARKHEIVGNVAVVEERIVIEGDVLHYLGSCGLSKNLLRGVTERRQ